MTVNFNHYPYHPLRSLWIALVQTDNYQATLTEQSHPDDFPDHQCTCKHTITSQLHAPKYKLPAWVNEEIDVFTFAQTFAPALRAGSDAHQFLKCGTGTPQSATTLAW